jgi:hypothetical protein
MIKVETNDNNINQVSGIDFGIPAFSPLNSCNLYQLQLGEIEANFQFFTADGSTTGSELRMTISEFGEVSCTGSIIGSGTALTDLNYNAIPDKQDLSGYTLISN